MSKDFDICIIGSGAGAGPVAYTAAMAGYSVLVLEKGPWLTEKEFNKDELVLGRRSVYTPNLRDERHVIEQQNDAGEWEAESTYDSGWDFWNGNLVGGSSNLMSGFFHRMKPVDFRLLSTFGPIEGANIVDWPISYQDMEPYFTKVEQIVGVSGKAVAHPFLEPRSTSDFPFPPTLEHPIAQWIDQACQKLGYHAIPTPRAILPYGTLERSGCSYSNYCGSYPCATGAKGNAWAALLKRALNTGNLEIRPRSFVYKLISDQKGNVSEVAYYDKEGRSHKVDAKIYVVACQAIESARLLLLSTGPKHPDGLANNHGQVGKNLIFSAGGSGTGDFRFSDLSAEQVQALKTRGLFVNRALQDWYVINDPDFGETAKGGTIDFLFRHPNAITRANGEKWDDDQLVWGSDLKKRLEDTFLNVRYLQFEVFTDWSPNDNCFVTLDPKVKDKWGNPVARVRIGYHEHDVKVGVYLSERGEDVLRAMNAKNVRSYVSVLPPANLVAGGIRFGNDPETSVLDADCRAHDVENLYVTDGSFMPTGGSVPYTWTIYANSFRVADKIVERLGGSKS